MSNIKNKQTTKEMYQRIGIFSILILSGLQLFLWSKENRELKIVLLNTQQNKTIYKFGFISTISFIALSNIYNFINITSNNKKQDSFYIRKKI